MQALVSGQAARVVFVQGTEVSFFEAENPETIISVDRHLIPHLLRGATDVETMEVENVKDTFPLLLRKFNFDRSLRMLDIAISTKSSDRLRRDAAAVFESLIDDAGVLAKVQNYTFATYNENILAIDAHKDLFSGREKFLEFIEVLSSHQVFILEIGEALEQVFATTNASPVDAAAFHAQSVEAGVFRNLVVARRENSKANEIILKAYLALDDAPNARRIIKEWTKDFAAPKKKRSLQELEYEYEEFASSSKILDAEADAGRYDKFLAVKRQQEAIVSKLADGDVVMARRFARDLVKSQMRLSRPEYAAKSLSNLAMEARKRGQQSLELEWAKQAVDLVPQDSIALGVLADTYLSLFRLVEANQSFKAALDAAHSTSNSSFARVGLARTLKASGQLDQALQAFSDLKETVEAPEKERPFVWLGYCSVLRDMWQFQAALDAVENAILECPDTPILRCLRAATLADLGNLDAALAAYAEVSMRFPDEHVALCGKASTLAKVGELDRALLEYDLAIKQFPNELVPYVGRAHILRMQGKCEQALDEYKNIAKRFPHDASPLCGEAETLREMGDYHNALAVYDEAVRRFKLDRVARCGRANLFKVFGDYKLALQAYDANVQDFPYDLVSLSGRADLLMRLGDYDEASNAYDLIIKRHPGFQYASVAKAAVHVARKEYELAEAILPNTEPKTEDDWVAFHIRGMIAVGRNEFDRAIEVFSAGLNRTPFFRHRKYFRSGLASAKMRKRDFAGAVEILDKSDVLPISKLLLIHSLSEIGKFDEAKIQLESINDNVPPLVRELRNELGARYGLDSSKSLKSEAWVFEREAELLLHAA